MYFISKLIKTFDISDNQDPKLVFYFTKEKESAAVQLVVIAKIYITHQNQQLYHSLRDMHAHLKILLESRPEAGNRLTVFI